MLKKEKRVAVEQKNEEPLSKKFKKSKKVDNVNISAKVRTQQREKNIKPKKFDKSISDKKNNIKYSNKGKPTNKDFRNKKAFNKNHTEKDSKPPNWNEFKKKKKEVQLKRKENKSFYDVVVKVKKIGEKLRCKTLKGGDEERNKIVDEIHEILLGKEHYSRLVMTHDMARIIQYLLKFGSEKIIQEITTELKGVVVDMLQSKYAKYCITKMLKRGNDKVRSDIIESCYGNAVKLASHAVSSPIFNDAFSTYATSLQKQHLIQEFFGDMYKQSKENSIKHLKDVYEKSPDMKTAVLSATKINLQRILNKQLLDSHLVQTVLMQYLQECSKTDRNELISQLASHAAVLSNSKEGVKAVMSCIWHGTNKDRKIIVKNLKEHVIPLSKHEHGYCSIITVIDSTDDTLFINKVILTEIVNKTSELINNEWGRKVLTWLVAPGNTAYFHPIFINELKIGRESSESKKDPDVRYKEILNYVVNNLLKQIAEEPEKWFANSSTALLTSAILKAGSGEELEKAFEAIVKLIINENWQIKENDTKLPGIEHSGIHMILKKIIQNDKSENKTEKFSAILVKHMNTDIVKNWIKCNRGCFLLINVIESSSEEIQHDLKKLLHSNKKTLKKCSSAGSNLLLQKLT